MSDPSPAPAVPVRYLLDHRLFRLLCAPGREAALESFRASLASHGLSPEGELPPLELTPLAFLEVLGNEPPQLPIFPLPPAVLKSSESLMATTLLVRLAVERYRENAPEIHRDRLKERVAELRKEAAPAAHDLFDLCLTRFAEPEGFEERVYGHLAFDFMYRFPFPEVLREEVFDFLCASLFAAGETVAGFSKARMVKRIWDRAYERLLKGNPAARGELQALDREIKPRTREDYFAWELLHHATLGYSPEDSAYAMTVFALDSAETVTARCIAYKTAIRAFLDQIERSDFSTIRSRLDAWKPGTLVPCREDGSIEAVVPTADLPVFVVAKELRARG